MVRAFEDLFDRISRTEACYAARAPRSSPNRHGYIHFAEDWRGIPRLGARYSAGIRPIPSLTFESVPLRLKCLPEALCGDHEFDLIRS